MCNGDLDSLLAAGIRIMLWLSAFLLLLLFVSIVTGCEQRRVSPNLAQLERIPA